MVNWSEAVILAMPKSVILAGAVRRDHDVRRLDVAMDDALLVRVVERRGGLRQDAQQPGRRRAAAAPRAPGRGSGPSTYSMAM